MAVSLEEKQIIFADDDVCVSAGAARRSEAVDEYSRRRRWHGERTENGSLCRIGLRIIAR